MSILVIHSKDTSTDFLTEIYRHTPHTLVNKSIPNGELISLIKAHDRVVMLGHGSPNGLFGTLGFLVDGRVAPYLEGKDNVYIWCHASRFVSAHGLSGFTTGMFISEVAEAKFCGLGAVSQSEVTHSNDVFAALVGEVLQKPGQEIYEYLINNYTIHCDGAVADYNWKLLACI